MKKIKISYILFLFCATVFACTVFTACDSLFGNNISIENEYLVTDHTCYIGNYHCPKLYVKVRNNSNSNYSVWIDVNFYYKNELASSKSSPLKVLSSGDTYTFIIQSSSGTRLYMDGENWTYKITKMYQNRK